MLDHSDFLPRMCSCNWDQLMMPSIAGRMTYTYMSPHKFETEVLWHGIRSKLACKPHEWYSLWGPLPTTHEVSSCPWVLGSSRVFGINFLLLHKSLWGPVPFSSPDSPSSSVPSELPMGLLSLRHLFSPNVTISLFYLIGWQFNHTQHRCAVYLIPWDRLVFHIEDCVPASCAFIPTP